jgi:hypothetical protein
MIGLYFGNSGTIEAMTTELTPEYMVSITNGDYQRVAGTFTPATSGTYYLGIKNRMAGNIFYMSLDDISVTPNDYGLLSEGFEAGIPENWTVINADSGISWVIRYSSAHGGSCSALAIADTYPRSDDWLITPPLQLSTLTNDNISFWMRATSQEDWEVLISTTDTQPASFTMIDSGVITSTNYIQQSYNLDSYGNAVVYIAVRYRGDFWNGYEFLVDDFLGPLIYVPTALDTPVATITGSGSNVTLNWDAVAGAGEYHVYLSDNPYSWLTNYSTVTAPTHSYSFDAGAVSSQFFKVVAVSGRTNLPPTLMPATNDRTPRLEEIKDRLKSRNN